MDLWRSFDLTPKTLEQFVNNIDLLKKMFENGETIDLFFCRFPFEKLLNITIMDTCSLNLSIRILDTLADYKEFYRYDDPFHYSLEFILINLSQITRDCTEIFSLFQVLSKILDSNLKSIDDSFKNVFDKERILEVMLKVARFETANKHNFAFYDLILDNLLKDNFPDSINSLVSELFEQLKKHETITEMSIICKHILNRSKLLCDSFKNIRLWLIEECPSIITEYHNEDSLTEIIHCLSALTTNFDHLKTMDLYKSPELLQQVNRLYRNLIKITSDICLHSSNPRLRSDCFKLLEFVLTEFFEEEKFLCFTKLQVANELKQLSEDAEQWPKCDCDIFLCICHMAIWYSRMIWKKEDTLNSIVRCFYNRRYLIKTYVLKSIYFLYPVLMDDADDSITRTIGDDLLDYFMKFCTVPHLYSYNSHQLNWMLTRGPKQLKLTVLSQWMNVIDSEDKLASAIRACHAELTLLDLLLEANLTQKISSKSASLIRKVTTPELSRNIAEILPLTVHEPKIFHNLILAGPAVPLDSGDSMLICTLMGAVMPTLDDSEVLRGACVFSSKLLASLKNNPDVVKEFCKNIKNIDYLVRTIEKVDDDTAIEIIRLLKAIIIIQGHNKVKMEQNLTEDFKIFMKGSSEKIEKSLKLLYHIMSYKHSLITIEEKCALKIYYAVLDLSANSSLQSLAYNCVVKLLKRMPRLAQTFNTIIHLEISCLAIHDNAHTRNLLKMLNTWLTIIRREPYNGFCPIPEKAIKNFVIRASLGQKKTQEYLALLDELIKRQRF